MTNQVEWLNSLPATSAQAELLKCCGSDRWARAVSESRPFASMEELLQTAERIWWSLRAEDWLEAFRAHPRIGEQRAATEQTQEAQSWSTQEQSGVVAAGAGIKSAMAEGNREYEKQFGFIFIVCATGKSAPEMLELLQARLENDRESELAIAANEQNKITRLRLEKLLQQ